MDYGAAVREWVKRTCSDQGLPAKVAEVATILKVASILVEASDAPKRLEASDVDVLRASSRRANDDVIQKRSDDGALLVKIEVGPATSEVGGLIDESAE